MYTEEVAVDKRIGLKEFILVDDKSCSGLPSFGSIGIVLLYCQPEPEQFN